MRARVAKNLVTEGTPINRDRLRESLSDEDLLLVQKEVDAMEADPARELRAKTTRAVLSLAIQDCLSFTIQAQMTYERIITMDDGRSAIRWKYGSSFSVERTLPISRDSMELVGALATVPVAERRGNLFFKENGEPATACQITQMIMAVAEAAGLRPFGFRVLHRTGARKQMAQGRTVSSLRMAAGRHRPFESLITNIQTVDPEVKAFLERYTCLAL